MIITLLYFIIFLFNGRIYELLRRIIAVSELSAILCFITILRTRIMNLASVFPFIFINDAFFHILRNKLWESL